MCMSLEIVRAEITRVDTEIVRLIAQRQDLACEIAKIKSSQGIPVHDAKRAAEVIESAVGLAEGHNIDPVAVRKIFAILIAMSEERQKGVRAGTKTD